MYLGNHSIDDKLKINYCMYSKGLFFCILLSILCACSEDKNISKGQVNMLEKLKRRAADNANSLKWDKEQFARDKKVYSEYADVFKAYPLNCSPFPVADYDYAVTSMPFSVESKLGLLKGLCIGDFETIDREVPKYSLTLLLLTKGRDYTEDVFVQSRNYPYLTAQGFFSSKENHFDWVFMKSPDEGAFCFVNMKLFDLRFGETILLIPRAEQSFSYLQLQECPNDYESLEKYKDMITKYQNLDKLMTQ